MVQHLAGITVEQARFLSLPIGKGGEAIEGKSFTGDRGHDIEGFIEVAAPIVIGKIKPDIEDATSNTIIRLSPWMTAYHKTGVFVRVEVPGGSHHFFGNVITKIVEIKVLPNQISIERSISTA